MVGDDGVTLIITGCEHCQYYYRQGKDTCPSCAFDFEEGVEVTA